MCIQPKFGFSFCALPVAIVRKAGNLNTKRNNELQQIHAYLRTFPVVLEQRPPAPTACPDTATKTFAALRDAASAVVPDARLSPASPPKVSAKPHYPSCCPDDVFVSMHVAAVHGS